MPYGKGTCKLAHEWVGSVERGHTPLGGWGVGGTFEGHEGALDAFQHRSELIALICPECGHKVRYSRETILNANPETQS